MPPHLQPPKSDHTKQQHKTPHPHYMSVTTTDHLVTTHHAATPPPQHHHNQNTLTTPLRFVADWNTQQNGTGNKHNKQPPKTHDRSEQSQPPPPQQTATTTTSIPPTVLERYRSHKSEQTRTNRIWKTEKKDRNHPYNHHNHPTTTYLPSEQNQSRRRAGNVDSETIPVGYTPIGVRWCRREAARAPPCLPDLHLKGWRFGSWRRKEMNSD